VFNYFISKHTAEVNSSRKVALQLHITSANYLTYLKCPYCIQQQKTLTKQINKTNNRIKMTYSYVFSTKHIPMFLVNKTYKIGTFCYLWRAYTFSPASNVHKYMDTHTHARKLYQYNSFGTVKLLIFLSREGATLLKVNCKRKERRASYYLLKITKTNEFFPWNNVHRSTVKSLCMCYLRDDAIKWGLY